VFRFDEGLKVYLHREAIDFRVGLNGLAILVEQALGLDPFAQAVYVFRNRRRDRVKILAWDRNGFWLMMKRLEERDRFSWPDAVTVPTLTVFRPAKPNGTALVVVPGGAFRALPWDLDGLETARWLTAHGITAFVLKYRVRPPGPEAAADRSFDDFAHRTESARAIAVADAEQAMRIVRSRARQFGVVPNRVGMIGFSAGAMATALAANAALPGHHVPRRGLRARAGHRRRGAPAAARSQHPHLAGGRR